MKILILILAVFSLNSFADWTKISAKEFSMAPPPEEGSEDYDRDFRILFEEQSNRTEAQCELSAKQKFPSYKIFFKDNQILTKEETDRAEELGKKVLKFAEHVSTHFKDKYRRERPYNENSKIHPCIEKPGGSKAYPSSHATEAWAGACMLSKIYPDRAGALIEYGRELGYLRVVVGVHHPSDVEAGQQLAQDICDRLMQESDFKKEIKALKSESN
jgi:acid phosphatase (class A)